MKEVYRIIEGYNGRYQISNYGNVYSAKSKRLLKPSSNYEGGELYVHLSNKGSGSNVQVGKLVLQYFRPSQIPQSCVLHFDLNRENNMSNNLAYGTRGDKRREAVRIKNKPRGVTAFIPSKFGVPTYRASLKVDGTIYSLKYSKDKEKCELVYITAYLAAYGALPYTEEVYAN